MPPPSRRSDDRPAGVDLNAVANELYTTPPERFIAAREDQVAATKTAGDAAAARRIHALRRPTLAAWASNLLVREKPEEVQQFLQLGEALRRAHQDLDGAQIRELGGQQWKVISALSRQAVQLAQGVGQRITDTVQRDIEATLRAVVADPGAADEWAAGRLHSALTPPADLPTADTAGTAATRPPSSPLAPARSSKDNSAASRRKDRAQQLADAKRAAKEAARRQRDAQKQQAKDHTEADRAAAERDRAQRHVDGLEQQLHDAREAAESAGQAVEDAAARQAHADDAVAQAERDVGAANRHVQRLSR